MGKFSGGVKEAAKMLMGLGTEAQKKLLEEIRLRDPKMAEQLESNLVSIEDIQYLTSGMLVSLLREINLERFGLALRTVNPVIVDKLMQQLSTGLRLDIEDGLKGKPRAVSEIQAAQAEVVQLLQTKIQQGHIVIDPQEKMV
jgi:flagellar motor switch protein FliG